MVLFYIYLININSRDYIFAFSFHYKILCFFFSIRICYLSLYYTFINIFYFYGIPHVIFRFYRSFPRGPSDIPKPKVINFPEFRARARNKIQHSGKYSLFLPGVLLPVRTSDDRPQTTANRQNTTRHEQTG